MLGRTFLVILFFWAALTIITPILVRLSASAKPMDYSGGIKNGGSQSHKAISLLSRRALGSIKRPQTEIPVSVSVPVSAPVPPPVVAPTPVQKATPLMDSYIPTTRGQTYGNELYQLTSMPKIKTS